jgi:hypothetical protein
MRRSRRPLLLLAALAACADGSTAPARSGGLELRLSQLPAAAALVTSAAETGDVPMGAVVRHQVERVDVLLTAVQALRAGAGEGEEAAWVRIPVEPALPVNLLALPTTLTDALVLPRGDLPAGAYQNLRLIVEDATITFSAPVSVGPRTWPAGEAHPLRIPGPQATRLHVPTSRFTIEDDDATVIDLVLNPGTSVQTITATPNFVQMAPVLLATPRGPR